MKHQQYNLAIVDLTPILDGCEMVNMICLVYFMSIQTSCLVNGQ